MQGHEFTDEVQILPLGCCDAVLRVERVEEIQPSPFYFNQLSLTFAKEEKSVSLKGTTDSAELHLIGSNGIQKVFKKE